uniref:EF-hand domain-containing protein n=1 Tax=Eiseniibacteriota bacterium TaxID=2212470 RepID=A0A832I6T0_UNCEI
MTGLVRKATLLSVCGLIAAGAAFANVPDPAQSIVPAGVRLVGSNAGVADAAGTFSVTVKDIGGNLIANSSVVVDFSAMSDIRLCSTSLDGSTVDCALKTVRAFTNGSGVATFRVLGGSTGAFTSFGAPLVEVFADGVLLATIRGAAFDLNNAGGVGAADLAIWLGDAGSGSSPHRADYDANGTVGAADLSQWLATAGAGGSATSCGTPCP